MLPQALFEQDPGPRLINRAVLGWHCLPQNLRVHGLYQEREAAGPLRQARVQRCRGAVCRSTRLKRRSLGPTAERWRAKLGAQRSPCRRWPLGSHVWATFGIDVSPLRFAEPDT
ncbi:hypothetical protein RRG08_066647 [Elysia crispata]|uniref:Uncharacterized protein n=1 Tax=Elysia crispata TaxID=231223 RepID=A0AAE0ZLN8_9GAST|nr:hypothetical protein RRG08_066647 [Elysia crispata]